MTGQPETGGEGVDIDTHLLLFGDIQHVQRDDAGDPQLEQLQRQIEVSLKVGGINHVNQHVGIAAQDVVAGNLLVQRGLRRDGGQGVGSRQVDQRDLMVSGGENASLRSTVTPAQLPTRWRAPVS